jgi:hypothetical protein
MRKYLGVLVLLALTGCMRTEIETTIHVLEPLEESQPRTFRVFAEGGMHVLKPGKYNVKLVLGKEKYDLTYLYVKETSTLFKLNLPLADDLLGINDELRLTAQQLGQPFSMSIIRDVLDRDTSRYAVSFMEKDFSRVLATVYFNNDSNKVAYDKNSMEFLQSYQDVRYSQRGTMIPIDGGLVQPFNDIVNYAAMVYAAPWVYARYEYVRWALSEKADDTRSLEKQWRDLARNTPVIDMFSFTHSGGESVVIRPAQNVGLKKNQLRVAYTEGCSSGSASHMIANWNAAVSAGHRATSASPFFAFPLIHAWVYGNDFEESIDDAWGMGKFLAKTGDYLSFGYLSKELWGSQANMIESSELMYAWTPEMEPRKLYIGTSAAPRRQTQSNKVVYETSVMAARKKQAATIALQLN